MRRGDFQPQKWAACDDGLVRLAGEKGCDSSDGESEIPGVGTFGASDVIMGSIPKLERFQAHLVDMGTLLLAGVFVPAHIHEFLIIG